MQAARHSACCTAVQIQAELLIVMLKSPVRGACDGECWTGLGVYTAALQKVHASIAATVQKHGCSFLCSGEPTVGGYSRVGPRLDQCWQGTGHTVAKKASVSR